MEFENMMQIIEYVIQILAGILVVFILPTIKAWLSEKIGADNADFLYQQICIFAQAAEQLLKSEDPDGSKRREYVVRRVQELGIEVNQIILDKIESAVWNINSNNLGTIIETDMGE